jgi:hypothetical protein
MRKNGRMDITSVRPSRGMWEPVDNKEGEMAVLNLGVGLGLSCFTVPFPSTHFPSIRKLAPKTQTTSGLGLAIKAHQIFVIQGAGGW